MEKKWDNKVRNLEEEVYDLKGDKEKLENQLQEIR